MWGIFYPQFNGSFIGPGMVGDVFHGRADIAVADVGMMHSRAKHVDFLTPINRWNASIFVPNLDATELIDLNAYFVAFTSKLWLVVYSSIIVITIFKLFLYFQFEVTYSYIEIIGFLWTSFIANFGGKPSCSKIDSKESYKFIIFVSLLSGAVIWISYRAKLTSELSIIDKSLPFTDLESFYKSNWRYVLINKLFIVHFNINLIIHNLHTI